MSTSLIIFLGLANWLATTILVESELLRPVRDRLAGTITMRRFEWDGHANVLQAIRAYREGVCSGDMLRVTKDYAEEPITMLARGKLAYLLGCHLCTGTWVGFIMAAVAGSPVPGLAGIVLGGLIYKAIGHLTLEVVGRLRVA